MEMRLMGGQPLSSEEYTDPRRRHMDILDDIYHKAEKNTIVQLKNSKHFDENGHFINPKQKTIIEEQMEQIEEKVLQRFYRNKTFDESTTVTEVTNMSLVNEESKANYEKLKGRFNLKINYNLQMGKKIEMYANDNIAFYLHKNRNFIQKLERHKKEKEHEKKMKELDIAEAIELQRIKDENKLVSLALKKQNIKNEKLSDARHWLRKSDALIDQMLSTEEVKEEDEDDILEQQARYRDMDKFVEQTMDTTDNDEDKVVQFYDAEKEGVVINISPKTKFNIQQKQHETQGDPRNTFKTRRDMQVKHHKEPYYKSKTKKFEDVQRNLHNLNMMFNKLLTQSLDTSTSATKSFRNIQSRGLTSKSFQSNAVPQKKVTNEFPSLSQSKRENIMQSFATHRQNLNTTVAYSRQDLTNSLQMHGLGSAIFMSEDQRKLEMQKDKQRTEMKVKIKSIIDRCLASNKQTKNNLYNYRSEVAAQNFKQHNFEKVFNTLRELETTEAGVIDRLYQYKVTDQQEFEDEASQVTKEYKTGLLDPTREVSKFERQMRFKRRKELLKGLIKIKTGK